MGKIPNNPEANDIYEIRVMGIPDASLADWFDGMVIMPQENGESLLIGKFIDQAALRGLLDHLWNRNIKILSLERRSHEHKK